VRYPPPQRGIDAMYQYAIGRVTAAGTAAWHLRDGSLSSTYLDNPR